MYQACRNAALTLKLPLLDDHNLSNPTQLFRFFFFFYEFDGTTQSLFMDILCTNTLKLLYLVTVRLIVFFSKCFKLRIYKLARQAERIVDSFVLSSESINQVFIGDWGAVGFTELLVWLALITNTEYWLWYTMVKVGSFMETRKSRC